MAGAFSGHLLKSYHTGHAMNPSLVTSGAMSFDPAMHGTPTHSFSFSPSQFPFTPTPFANENMSEATAMKIAALQVKLNQKLGPEFISQRQGPRGGPKLTYAEGWKIINLANEVFGFNGWCSNLVNVTTDFVDRSESGRYNVGVTAVVRVTLRDGVFHEDVGYGTADNSPSKGQALDKCKKEAVTDGLKRALRNFGNLMGNCLYDKAYTQEVVKMKVLPAKFDKTELHRRPEFAEENKPSTSPTSNLGTSRHTPPFNHNISTSSSASASTSVARQLGTVRGKESLPNGRPPIDFANNNVPSTSPDTSAQSASNVSNQSLRFPQEHQPRQEPQQQNRRVSFAETSRQELQTTPVKAPQNALTKGEPEDNFDFGDDDAFLAALGMEEGDLGRPIEIEADIGQPITHEESFLPPDDDISMAASDTSASNVSINNIPQNVRARRLQRLQQEIMNANVNPLDTSPPIQQSTPTKQQTLNDSSSTHGAASGSKPTALRPPNGISHQNHDPNVSRNHRPFAPGRSTSIQNHHNHTQNENLNPPLSSSSSGESGGRRSLTVSMGGFYFPPGMNPPQSHKANVQQVQQGGGSAGIKRSADIMTGSGNGGSGMSGSGGGAYRCLGPGMRLQQAAPQRRVPFVPLEVGEGGDIKRIKR